jgi:hypothetical protein
MMFHVVVNSKPVTVIPFTQHDLGDLNYAIFKSNVSKETNIIHKVKKNIRILTQSSFLYPYVFSHKSVSYIEVIVTIKHTIIRLALSLRFDDY